MRRRLKGRWKRVLIILAAAAVCCALAALGLAIYGKYQMDRVPGLSFQEALAYTTENNPEAVITVGILHDGTASYTVYGENGRELPRQVHTYEIGSLTKTFTAALISRAAEEGRVALDASIDRYLDLPEGRTYPTVERLLTHTSGYSGYYLERPMIANFLRGRNDFFGVTRDMVLSRTGRLDVPEEGSPFCYSNFGYAVLGLVLESVYGLDYGTLVERFAQEELHLANTRLSTRDGDLGRYWDWQAGDAYLSAGGLTSDIEDMLAYARLHLDGPACLTACHRTLAAFDAAPEQYKRMGIRMDGIGMAWIVDGERSLIWHNGGTDSYNCYLGLNPQTGTAVAVLSNLSPRERLPATVLGVKLLEELAEQNVK